jgi:hypothetical protein
MSSNFLSPNARTISCDGLSAAPLKGSNPVTKAVLRTRDSFTVVHLPIGKSQTTFGFLAKGFTMKIKRSLTAIIFGALLSTSALTAHADTTTVTTKLTATQAATQKAAQKTRLAAFNAAKAAYASAIATAKKNRDVALAAARTANKKTAPVLADYSKAVNTAIANRDAANKAAEAAYAATLKAAGINP